MQLVRALKRVAPSGLRQLYRERNWRRRHGLVAFGETTPRWISPSSRFGRNCRVNGRVHIVDSRFGDWSYVEMEARIMGADIGRYSAIGPTAQVGLPGHPVADNVSMHPRFYQHRPEFNYDLVDADVHPDLRPTKVGHDVWVGAGALILDGVAVGDGAVIGAGSVVTRDVHPYAVVAGAPAKVLRYRFHEETIRFLLALRWWDRSESWLRENAALMQDVSSCGPLRIRTPQASVTDPVGEIDSAALHSPKRFFGTADNLEECGSLTIVATSPAPGRVVRSCCCPPTGSRSSGSCGGCWPPWTARPRCSCRSTS